MIPSFTKTKNLQIIKSVSGRDPLVVPLALEFQVIEGSELFDNLMKEADFEEYRSRCLNREVYNETDLRHLNRLKKDCEGTKTKITVKIELEKYEI